MTQFITRAYNTFTFDYLNSTIKKHSKEDRLAAETQYYKTLPQHLSIYFPRLVSSGFKPETGEHFLELELYPYENLGRLLIEGQLKEAQWTEVAKHLFEILMEFGKAASDANFTRDMQAMYFEKTEREYKRLIENFPVFKKLSEQTTFVLNGKEYLNFESVWPKIKDKYSAKLVDASLVPSVIHGDFCFSNILLGSLKNEKNILRFVDPRGKFGSLMVYGDSYYDLAKLMHSTDIAYEYFIYDQFKIDQDNQGHFTLEYNNSNKLAVDKIFHEHLYSKYDITRIRLIEASIFVGMCPFHYDSENRQLAMYLSGVKLLNEILNNNS